MYLLYVSKYSVHRIIKTVIRIRSAGLIIPRSIALLLFLTLKYSSVITEKYKCFKTVPVHTAHEYTVVATQINLLI